MISGLIWILQIRYTTRDQDVDNILYQLRGSLTVVFAAGNYGQTAGGANMPGVQLASPATAKNVISVGASQNDLASVIGALHRVISIALI